MNRLDLVALAATAIATTAAVPQLRHTWVTRDNAGVSAASFVIGATIEAGWFAYAIERQLWEAAPEAVLMLAADATVAVLLGARTRSIVLALATACALAAVTVVAGIDTLGVVLGGSYVVQAAPSVWAAYRSAVPSGIAPMSWVLIGIEAACWGAWGLRRGDTASIAFAVVGLTTASLLLARLAAHRHRRVHPRRTSRSTLHPSMLRRHSWVGVGCLVVAGCAGGDPTPPAAVSTHDDRSVEIINRWNELRNAGDGASALALLDDDAHVFGLDISDQRQRDELEEIMRAQAAARWTVADHDCSVDHSIVTCRYEMQDDLLRRWHLVLTGTHTYDIHDGRIHHATRTHDHDSEAAVYGALESFRDWVRAHHPDLVDLIWHSPGAAAYTTVDGAVAALSLLDEYEPELAPSAP